ncbi:LFG3 protein, partial [Nycticryphes semicollaris]|nr:LFG3 protein [Nycticryphes semicollaris]
MAQPNAPPPYDDRNPLYPPPPGGYSQPPHYAGGYPQPGGYPAASGYPAAGGYPQPGGYPAGGGYPAAGGYPQPGMAMPTMPIRFGVSPTAGDDGIGDGSPFQSADWDDRKVRHAFIRKASPSGMGRPHQGRGGTCQGEGLGADPCCLSQVYAIISLQLLVTVGIIAVFTFVSPVRSFVQKNVAIYYASYAVFLVTYLVLACCQGPRRRFPWNIILLSIFVSGLGLVVGGPVTSAVLIAMLITAIVAIIVTIFCFQTKARKGMCPALPWGKFRHRELGRHTGLSSHPACVPFPVQVPWLHMLYAAIGAIAFTLFLAYDTQLVLGNRKNTLSPEEYVYGALTIYTDIIYIFTFILQIVGRD